MLSGLGRGQAESRRARTTRFVPERQVNLVAASALGDDLLDGAEGGQEGG